jgi:hypothetical protein
VTTADREGDGDLWPADEETARACGMRFDEQQKTNVPWVVFDPTFGGAVPAKTKNALQQMPAAPAKES